MASLSIKDFSCIKSAEFTVAPINVIIGAQGSGKSVTIKLLYFFTYLMVDHIKYAENNLSLEDYKKTVASRFRDLFPPSAWGNKPFCIKYKSSDFSVQITRREIVKSQNSQNVLDSIEICFSDWFDSFYEEEKEFLAKLSSKPNVLLAPNGNLIANFERMEQGRQEIDKLLSQRLKNSFIRDQIFIPSSRTFFTSVGDFLSANPHQIDVDFLTSNFARLFTSLKKRKVQDPLKAGFLTLEYYLKRGEFMTKLFGGELKFEEEKEFVDMQDGRLVPFYILSSGHQELLPIWVVIDFLNEISEYMKSYLHLNKDDEKPSQLLHIEEPEAHLFPKAQSLVIELLVSSMATHNSNLDLIITTHSPYIMSKLDIFLKAGEIAKDESKREAVREIVPEECWLTRDKISAYSIEDGVLKSIIDEESGLIDSSYLDRISEDLSADFSDLLAIQFEME